LLEEFVRKAGYTGSIAYFHPNWSRSSAPLLDHLGAVIDHVVPFSKGGNHDETNFVTACNKCNSRKNDTDHRDHVRRHPEKRVKGRYGEPSQWDGMSSLFLVLAGRGATLQPAEREWEQALRKRVDPEPAPPLIGDWRRSPPWPALVLCADWSRFQANREVYSAHVAEKRVERVTPPDGGWTVAAVLHEAARRRPTRQAVLVGFDAPLGLPRSFLEHAGARSFPAWLASVEAGAFGSVSEPEAWCVARPFFRVPAGTGSLTAFVRSMEKQGIAAKREIDRRTRAKPVFITSGIPGAVGSSAVDLWQGLANAPAHVVWPFDGPWEVLSQGEVPIVAEIYPRLAYALAQSPLAHRERRPLAVAKTKRPIREAFLVQMTRSDGWLSRHGVTLDEVSKAQALESEDAFDALVTAAGLLRCVLERTPLSDPALEDSVAEGGILGSGSVRLDLPEESFAEPAGARSRADRHADGKTQTPGRSWPCPIPGCPPHVFRGSRGGWDAHVTSIENHPNWHPDVTDPDERKRLFRASYPEFFR